LGFIGEDDVEKPALVKSLDTSPTTERQRRSRERLHRLLHRGHDLFYSTMQCSRSKGNIMEEAIMIYCYWTTDFCAQDSLLKFVHSV
jgi:hypothetical protein